MTDHSECFSSCREAPDQGEQGRGCDIEHGIEGEA